MVESRLFIRGRDSQGRSAALNLSKLMYSLNFLYIIEERYKSFDVEMKKRKRFQDFEKKVRSTEHLTMEGSGTALQVRHRH